MTRNNIIIVCICISLAIVTMNNIVSNYIKFSSDRYIKFSADKEKSSGKVEVVRYAFDKNTGDVYFPEINPDNKKLKSVTYSCKDEVCLLNVNY